jgi:nondiscriminating aspartyl-tRNA synthetase
MVIRLAEQKRILVDQAAEHMQSKIILQGHVQGLRRMGGLAFLILRDRSGIIQVVLQNPDLLRSIESLNLESAIEIHGTVASGPQNNNSVEVHADSIIVLGRAQEAPPIELGKNDRISNLAINTLLDYRPLTLRNEKIRSVFRIQSALCTAFANFLQKEDFTEIRTSKIASTGTEGGANLFRLDYFGQAAYLAQSPQFYKQIMVGVFERVYEIGPVYRAEEHDTTRHINEYVSMDLEMGFIESEQDLIALQTRLLKSMFAHLQERCYKDLAGLEIRLPQIETIPQITLFEAHSLLENRYGWKGATDDLDSDAERMLSEHFLVNEQSEFVYVTSYPLSARPFYAMPHENPQLSRSFDLLFRGLEITTGGQRIHEYDKLIEIMALRGLAPERFKDYLQCFKFGMPPHGGLAIGLERLTKQLASLPNVKLASLFPRDRNRLSP